MITVIASHPKNPSHHWLHWQFMEETCRSFGAHLLDIEQGIPPGPRICLCHDRGLPLSELIWPPNPVILAGCDDSGEHDDWLSGGLEVRIETPVPYFLWSPVAVGIALYHRVNSRQRLSTIKNNAV